MQPKQLIKALHNGDMIYSSLIISPSPKWPTVMQDIGLDCVFIDTEHISLDIHNLSWMCQTYKALNLPPIVRIPSPCPYQATKAMDAGACGIIAPYIETAEQVKHLRGAVKMRPLKGKKMNGALFDNKELEPGIANYLKKFNEEHILIVNIESTPALEALDEILDVPELDAVLIGPHDLTTSLGIPQQYDHPLFDKTVREIIKKARAKNVGAGIHFWPSVDQEIEWAKAGLNLLFHHSDMMLFRESIHATIKKVKESLGEKTTEEQLEDEAI